VDLSISETATALHKSERQVRYLIQEGKLAAKKKDGRWVIDSAKLPLGEAQRRILGESAAALSTAVAEAVAPPVEAMKKAAAPRFSVRDLRAFKSAEPVFRDVVLKLGDADPACLLLRDALDLLSQGCHSFHPREKVERYAAARERTATAVTRLLLGGAPGDSVRESLASRLEQSVLPDLSGLIRSTERAGRRDRFERFGAGR
jgi:hypothetical protein